MASVVRKSDSHNGGPQIGRRAPRNSDPLDEQNFVVSIINMLEQSPEWSSAAVIIAYDDSDGWYDHENHLVNPSASAQDAFLGAQMCGPLGTSVAPGAPPVNALPGVNGKPVNGRCGDGARQPLLVISPFAKPNFVDHTSTDQASILRFIENNWLGGVQIDAGSYDTIAGSVNNMFNFNQSPNPKLTLDPNLGARESN
ncbi:MAG: alkaline phosphatase family protein [Methylocella sp.]